MTEAQSMAYILTGIGDLSAARRSLVDLRPRDETHQT